MPYNQDMTPKPSPPPTVPIGEAARYLGISQGTLRNWEADNLIQATRSMGNQRRYSLAELDRVKKERAK